MTFGRPGERAIDIGREARLGDPADTEDRSEVNRRQDAVVDIGLVEGGLAAFATAVKHRLDPCTTRTQRGATRRLALLTDGEHGLQESQPPGAGDVAGRTGGEGEQVAAQCSRVGKRRKPRRLDIEDERLKGAPAPVDAGRVHARPLGYLGNRELTRVSLRHNLIDRAVHRRDDPCAAPTRASSYLPYIRHAQMLTQLLLL